MPTVNVLVVDGDESHDWSVYFKGCTVDLLTRLPGTFVEGGAVAHRPDGAAASLAGELAGASGGAPSADDIDADAPRVTCKIRVVQVGWDDFNLTAYAGEGCLVDVFKRGARHGSVACFRPHFLLVRNVVRGVTPDQDFRNLLYGLRYAGVPSVNSIESIIMTQERPLAHAALLDIERRLGSAAFPVLPQTYYPNHRAMCITPSYPIVTKVGHAHAGFGKSRLTDHHAFGDLKSVIALTSMYVTAEVYVEGAYDLRIQKIGGHYRAYKRTSMSGDWKTNTGTSVMEELELTAEYRRWVDEASNSFGGMDIVTVDAIHSAVDDREWILEMNGTSSGLAPEHEEEDSLHLRDLVLQRMVELVAAPAPRR